MATVIPPLDKYQEIKGILIDFGLPLIVLIILSTLLATGIDGEVKTLLAAVVGWITKSGISRATN